MSDWGARPARERTHAVRVGDVVVGGGAPVTVQSMCTTPTTDPAATLAQIASLADAGCEIVRVAVPTAEALDGFGEVCAASPLPVVADIHFDYRLAIGACRRGAAALRVNPGNIGSLERVDAVIDEAGAAGIPIRIGVNAGSLDPAFSERRDLTQVEKLVGSAVSFVGHFHERGFADIVLSAKAHGVPTTIEVNRALSRELPEVPLHIGVTEAGTARQGTVKNSAAVGCLLMEGIGDTMRLSLTADPVEEVLVAWDLLGAVGLRRRSPELVSCPTCGRCQWDLMRIAAEVERRLAEVRAPISVAVMGCAVNGPGEARDADIGLAGGKGRAMLFAGGERIRVVDEADAVDELMAEIGRRFGQGAGRERLGRPRPLLSVAPPPPRPLAPERARAPVWRRIVRSADAKGPHVKRYQKMSRLYSPTLKEDPAEAELASHRLLLRAGMIRKTAAGLYSYLPLAWRSIQKIEAIIRDEMESIGAQEMMVPILTPAELWQESGRWEAYGPELMRIDDRHGRGFALGPTHEETFTDLVKSELRSYKQLPVTLYQIQDKFRDEMRPRFGLMRGREFIMKDAYSFSATQESLQECYEQEKGAYARIAERCGIRALPVVADSGQIGGDTSVEFMALADAGEAELVWCDCGFAAEVVAATTTVPVSEGPGNGTLTRVHTPGLGSIEAVSRFFGFPENGTRKSLALVAEDGTRVVAIVPGDHELNEVKAEHLFGSYHMMSDEELEESGLFKGFIGPVNLPAGIRLVCDESLRQSSSWTCGANEVDYHFTGACPGRDFTVDEWADLVSVHAGDPCPHCGQPLRSARGIEISQVFQLGTKYSEAMGATFADEDGAERPLLMGCYGIGVSRTLAAVVEQHNDEHGISWPVSVAPYEVEVVPLAVGDDVVAPVAERLAGDLGAAGIEALIDDRKERAGVKFADADLIGIPYQVILGKRGVAAGTAEVKVRESGERFDVPLDDVCRWLAERVTAARS